MAGDQSVIYWQPPNLRPPRRGTYQPTRHPSTSTWNTNDWPDLILCVERTLLSAKILQQGGTSQVRCLPSPAVVTLALCNSTMQLPMMPHAASHRHRPVPYIPPTSSLLCFPPTLIHSRVCREADGRLKASFVKLAGVAIFWLGGEDRVVLALPIPLSFPFDASPHSLAWLQPVRTSTFLHPQNSLLTQLGAELAFCTRLEK